AFEIPDSKHQTKSMAAAAAAVPASKHYISWKKIEKLRYFFNQEIEDLIPELSQQIPSRDGIERVSVDAHTFEKLHELERKIHSKQVIVDSFPGWNNAIRNVLEGNHGYQGVKISKVAQMVIILESLDEDDLDSAKQDILIQLSNERQLANDRQLSNETRNASLSPPIRDASFSMRRAHTAEDSSSEAAAAAATADEGNTNEETMKIFNLPTSFKVCVYPEDINNCDVPGVISSRHPSSYAQAVTPVFDDDVSKYLLYVREPDSSTQSDESMLKQYITDLFYQCFQTAENLQLTSLATTLIFTGPGQVSLDLVLFSLEQSLNLFLKDRREETCLRQLHIVDQSQEISAIVSEFCTIYWPRQKTRRINSTTSRKEEETCSICLQVSSQKTFLPCEHWFCQPCLDMWLYKNSTCPSCRTLVQ
ncbi:uncharacterized protein LOC115219124 isoform X3, partial [Argonauta hians]